MSDPGPCVCWPSPTRVHPGHCCFSLGVPVGCHVIEGHIAAAKASAAPAGNEAPSASSLAGTMTDNITSIPLPEGYTWREVDEEAWNRASAVPKATRGIPTAPDGLYDYTFYLGVPIEPEWVKIPQGTICKIRTERQPDYWRIVFRSGESFADYEESTDGDWPVESILEVREVRVLPSGYVAVKANRNAAVALWETAYYYRTNGDGGTADILESYEKAVDALFRGRED